MQECSAADRCDTVGETTENIFVNVPPQQAREICECASLPSRIGPLLITCLRSRRGRSMSPEIEQELISRSTLIIRVTVMDGPRGRTSQGV